MINWEVFQDLFLQIEFQMSKSCPGLEMSLNQQEEEVEEGCLLEFFYF